MFMGDSRIGVPVEGSFAAYKEEFGDEAFEKFRKLVDANILSEDGLNSLLAMRKEILSDIDNLELKIANLRFYMTHLNLEYDKFIECGERVKISFSQIQHAYCNLKDMNFNEHPLQIFCSGIDSKMSKVVLFVASKNDESNRVNLGQHRTDEVQMSSKMLFEHICFDERDNYGFPLLSEPCAISFECDLEDILCNDDTILRQAVLECYFEKIQENIGKEVTNKEGKKLVRTDED